MPLYIPIQSYIISYQYNPLQRYTTSFKDRGTGPDKNHAKAGARRQVDAAICLAQLAAVGLEEGAQSSASAAVNEVAAAELAELSRESAKERDILQLAKPVPRAEVGAMKLASEAVLPMPSTAL